MNLKEELESIVLRFESVYPEVAQEYKTRIAEGNLTKDENPTSHFCAYFLPYNPDTKYVMLGDHKKSGKWLSPGGHVDKGETFLQTLNREIEEELGVPNFFNDTPTPFLLTITNIDRNLLRCRKHFDIWHLMETDGSNFKIDMTEYNEVKWLPIAEARKLTNDKANQVALKLVEQNKF